MIFTTKGNLTHLTLGNLIEKGDVLCEICQEPIKEYCDELDVANGDEVGTAYRDDPNVEFYIDTSNWHDISLALRKLNLGAKED